MNKQVLNITKLLIRQVGVKGIFKFALFIIFASGFVWIFADYREAKKQVALLSNPEIQKELYLEEVEETKKQVSKFIILPNEEPNLATVQNAETLVVQQPFFSGAINGDKVLIYKDKAIIYSPERDILVNVGPVYEQNEQQNNQQISQAPKPIQKEKNLNSQSELVKEEKKISLDIRNGSGVNGAANSLANTLQAIGSYRILNTSDASLQEHEETLLINLTLTGEDIEGLEKELNISSTDILPEGEATSNADAVIIIGKE